ncbi:DUF6875 domain-containing protein [Paraburkholderia silviterrae]|uniref:DUF6875 domain-containing protein n=1 Tax=Paraburkholderia silviterrae TaxID=2528715 RepID=A0A4R5M467_9BURK|nr:hypothetical protein [Paraburkholderia silviterrae]TDG20564.1 hypothetical protein EYW47_25640 [Paraburkholderia silviterrae]
MATNNDAYESLRPVFDPEIIKIERSACLSTEIESLTDEITRRIFDMGLAWLKGFIMEPHAELGRRGAVCPFARPVHNEDSLVFCAWDANNLRFNDFLCVLKKIPASYYRLLASMQGNSKLFSMCLFVRGLKEEQYGRYIDEAHSLIKPAFMEAGLMIGEFHPLSMTQGVHSETFLPMRSSQPAFVVRAMSPHDALFIDRTDSSADVRLRELTNYQRWVGDALPEAENARIRNRIAALRSAIARPS